MPNRAIALSGGGPAAALHIGALEYLAEQGIHFADRSDVWALSCIGAWVGIIHNTFDQNPVQQTKEFFRENVFRDNTSYDRFPINNVFGPDLVTLSRATTEFLMNPESYRNLVVPHQMMTAFTTTMDFFRDRAKWNEGDLSKVVLEQLAANPYTRFMMSLMYLSNINGLSRIYYKDSSFLKAIAFDKLKRPDKPFIFHNAYNLTTGQIDLFSNRQPDHDGHYKYRPLDAQTLCACSALPYVEETVPFDDGVQYCEGALVDTVNFGDLLDDNPQVQEIWVSRIVTYKQIKTPRNVYDGLGNLCMLFAATVADDDVKLFKYHARLSRPEPWLGQIIELEYEGDTNFDWNHKNFDASLKVGRAAAEKAYKRYVAGEFQEEHEKQQRRWESAIAKIREQRAANAA